MAKSLEQDQDIAPDHNFGPHPQTGNSYRELERQFVLVKSLAPPGPKTAKVTFLPFLVPFSNIYKINSTITWKPDVARGLPGSWESYSWFKVQSVAKNIVGGLGLLGKMHHVSSYVARLWASGGARNVKIEKQLWVDFQFSISLHNSREHFPVPEGQKCDLGLLPDSRKIEKKILNFISSLFSPDMAV